MVPSIGKMKAERSAAILHPPAMYVDNVLVLAVQNSSRPMLILMYILAAWALLDIIHVSPPCDLVAENGNKAQGLPFLVCSLIGTTRNPN